MSKLIDAFGGGSSAETLAMVLASALYRKKNSPVNMLFRVGGYLEQDVAKYLPIVNNTSIEFMYGCMTPAVVLIQDTITNLKGHKLCTLYDGEELFTYQTVGLCITAKRAKLTAILKDCIIENALLFGRVLERPYYQAVKYNPERVYTILTQIPTLPRLKYKYVQHLSSLGYTARQPQLIERLASLYAICDLRTVVDNSDIEEAIRMFNQEQQYKEPTNV